MPNWVHSGFEVKGATAEVARFKSMMFRPITNADRTFDPHRRGIVLDFNGIIPMPPEEALSNYVGWASLNWGVDRNADNLTIHSDEEDGICFQFDTPWGFPTPVFEALAREFPGLVFSGSAFEDSDRNEWKGEFNGANDWGPGEIQLVVNTGLTSKDLSRYRLPEFWRDASIILAVLPAAWVASRGLHHSLLLHEAYCGVESPADADVPASETPFHGDIDIRTATLCWDHATLHRTIFADHGVRVVDPTPRPLIEAPLTRLLKDFGSASALREALLAFVDGMLAESEPAPEYLQTFFDEREAMGVKIVEEWENPGHA